MAYIDNMRKANTVIKLIIVLAAIVSVSCNKYPVEYEFKDIRSSMIKKPDKAIVFAKRSADFWKKTYDKESGGFFTTVKPNGDIPGSYGRYCKTTLSQSHTMYAFARAYMLTGEKEYLTYAKYAADFLMTKSYDKANGGFYTIVGSSGNSLDLTDETYLELNSRQRQKWSRIQHHALAGPAALVEATRDEQLFDFLITSRTLLDTKLYDRRKAYAGYYESADYDWRNPRGKGLIPTLDGFATHAMALYLLTNDLTYKDRVVDLTDSIIDHIYPTAKERKIGFDQHYDADWNPSDESYIYIGNMLNTAWCLARTYPISPDEAYLQTADKIMHNIYVQAWDDTNGGPYYMADSIRGIITDDTKKYWTIVQGMTSGLLNYHRTGNPVYLKMADESAYFFERHIIDHEYGDVIDEVKANGKKIHRYKEEQLKGSYWKSAYHTLETAYYMYLYGRLYVHRKEASLYYHILKSDHHRSLPMNPIAEDKHLVMIKVDLNGKNYTDFDGQKRLLNIPPGIGGAFKVTYSIRQRSG